MDMAELFEEKPNRPQIETELWSECCLPVGKLLYYHGNAKENLCFMQVSAYKDKNQSSCILFVQKKDSKGLKSEFNLDSNGTLLFY